MVYLPTFTIHLSQMVGEYTIYMDPMGIGVNNNPFTP